MPNTPCPICGGDTDLLFPATTTELSRLEQPDQFVCTSLKVTDHSDVLKCKVCKTGFLWPQFSDSKLLALYESAEDPKYLDEERGREKTWKRVLEKCLPGGQNMKLLDIGSHAGLFIKLARARGWEAVGVETSSWGRKVATSRYGVTTYKSFDDIPKSSFDAITMFDVIEHLTDPVSMLNWIRQNLSNRGRIVITTPDLSSPLARIMGSKWYCIRQQHLFYFDPDSLRTLLEKNGLRVISISRYQRIFSIGYWLDRAATLIGAGFIARQLKSIPGLVSIPTGDEMLIVAEPK